MRYIQCSCYHHSIVTWVGNGSWVEQVFYLPITFCLESESLLWSWFKCPWRETIFTFRLGVVTHSLKRCDSIQHVAHVAIRLNWTADVSTVEPYRNSLGNCNKDMVGLSSYWRRYADFWPSLHLGEAGHHGTALLELARDWCRKNNQWERLGLTNQNEPSEMRCKGWCI